MNPPDPASDLDPWLVLASGSLRSRLIVGIEQYDSPSLVRDVLVASRSEILIVTVHVEGRRGLPIDALRDRTADLNLMLLGTTCHAGSGAEALAVARRLRDSLGVGAIKLDVRPDARRRLPDNLLTIRAAEALSRDGFDILPMITPDPMAAIELQALGCRALRLLAGSIRSGLGLRNLDALKAAKDAVAIPCVGEGGIGTVSDATRLIEAGFAAVLVNSAIAKSGSPALMARAMSDAVAAARLCYVARRMAVEPWALPDGEDR